jgi:hypothetical protein
MKRKWIPKLAWDKDGIDLDNWEQLSPADRELQLDREEIVNAIECENGDFSTGHILYDSIWETIPGALEVERFETAVLKGYDELIPEYFMQVLDIMDQVKNVNLAGTRDTPGEPANWFEAEELPAPKDVYRGSYYPNRTCEEEALERVTLCECPNKLNWEDYQWYRMIAPDSRVLELFQKAVDENNDLAITIGAISVYEDFNKVGATYWNKMLKMKTAYFLFPVASKYGALQKYAKLCEILSDSPILEEYKDGVDYGHERTAPEMLKILGSINIELGKVGAELIKI